MGLRFPPYTQRCRHRAQSPCPGSPFHPAQGLHPTSSRVPISAHPRTPSHPSQDPHPALPRVSIPPCPGSASHPSLLRVPIHPCPGFPFPLTQDPHLSLPSVPTLAAGIPVPVPGASSHRPLRCRFCLRPGCPGSSELGRAGTARPRCVIWGSRNAGLLRAGLCGTARSGNRQFEAFQPCSASNLLPWAALCCASEIPGGDPSCRAARGVWSSVCSVVHGIVPPMAPCHPPQPGATPAPVSPTHSPVPSRCPAGSLRILL